jgi:peptidoglycan/LPS O-acetylase OafA/YrhL
MTTNEETVLEHGRTNSEFVTLPVESPTTRLGDIQGLRAVAVMLVVAYHAGLPVQGGFVGVDVFFVISGFVITALLIRELTVHRRIRFYRFYSRRVRRLLPALALVLIVTAVASMLLQSPLGAQQDTAVAGVGASAWLANGALYIITGGYFDNAADSIPLLHMWSLAVEEQFYLAFPALLALGFLVGQRVLRRGLRGATIVMTVVFALSFALSIWLSYGHGLPAVTKPAAAAFYSAPTRAWEFGAGALVAIWAARARPLSPLMAMTVSVIGALLLAAAAAVIPITAVFPGVMALVPVLGTAMLIAAGRTSGNAVARLLAATPLQRVGDVSYSWYLWHWPFIVFSSLLWPERKWITVVAAAMSLVVAWLSFNYFEQPIRRHGGKAKWATPRLVFVCVSIPLVLFATLYSEARRSWGDADIAAMAKQVNPVPIGYRSGCHSSVPIPNRDLKLCTFVGSAAGRRIFVIGDSNAGQYAEAVVAAGKSLQRTVVLTTMSGCPFVDVYIQQPGFDGRTCRTFVTESTKWLETQKPSTLILASANETIADPRIKLEDPTTGELARDPASKERVWTAGLERTIGALRKAGHTVVLVNVIPHLSHSDQNWWDPADCNFLTLRSNVQLCGLTVPLRQLDVDQSRALASEHAAAGKESAQELNLRSVICPREECSTNNGDFWVYRNGLHIATQESARLAPEFERAILMANSGGKQ